MNILHVVNISFVIPYFLGGQLTYFRNKGYKEYIVCSPSDELLVLSKKFQFDYRMIPISRKISLISDLKALIGICSYIHKNEINIVTGHTPKGALLAMLAAYIIRIPIRIYFRHGLVYETSRGLKRILLISMDRLAGKLSTKIVCVSPSVCQRSIENGLNKAEKQTLLLRGTCNGIDIKRFNRYGIQHEVLLDLREQLGFDDDDCVIGFTGRLVKDKGIIELVEAFSILQEKYSNIRLLLVGMLEERDALPKNIIESIIKNPNIITTGYISNSFIEYYYALMNIFILLSYREGFPTSVLEASAMELPVITTRVTGCIDSIIENRTGVFVSHNVQEISSIIERFYINRQLGVVYGKNGRSLVEQNFRQELIWNEIEKLYRIKSEVDIQ